MGLGSKVDYETTESSEVESATHINKDRVDLNNLMKKVKEEEKRTKRQNIVVSAAALSAVAVFGIILTL